MVIQWHLTHSRLIGSLLEYRTSSKAFTSAEEMQIPNSWKQTSSEKFRQAFMLILNSTPSLVMNIDVLSSYLGSHDRLAFNVYADI